MPATRHRRWRPALVVGTALVSLTLGTSVMAGEAGEGRNMPIEFLHNNLEDAPVAGAVWAAGPALKNGDAICGVAASSDPNVNLSCGPTRQHNETSIAVNPVNPDNMIYGRERLPARHQPRRPCQRLDPLARDRHLRRRRHLDRLSDPDQRHLPGDGRSCRRVRRRGQRLLRDARVPASSGPRTRRTRTSSPRSQDDGGVHWDSHRVAAGSGVGTSPSATSSTRSTSRRGATGTRS